MKFTTSLKKNFQFKIVYNKGKSIANRQLVMYILPNGTSSNHLGISVSKKIGNSVVRSRVTRLIKESYRKSENNIKYGLDIVLIARVGSNSCTFFEISNSLNHLLKKHSIFRKEPYIEENNFNDN